MSSHSSVSSSNAAAQQQQSAAAAAAAEKKRTSWVRAFRKWCWEIGVGIFLHSLTNTGLKL